MDLEILPADNLLFQLADLFVMGEFFKGIFVITQGAVENHVRSAPVGKLRMIFFASSTGLRIVACIMANENKSICNIAIFLPFGWLLPNRSKADSGASVARRSDRKTTEREISGQGIKIFRFQEKQIMFHLKIKGN